MFSHTKLTAREPYCLGHTLLLLTPNSDSNGPLVSLHTSDTSLGNGYDLLWRIYQRLSMGPIGVP